MLLTSITIGNAAITALLGYGIVFFGLILLMLVVIVIGKCFASVSKTPEKTEAPAVAPAPVPVSAPGSAGGVKLYNVDPKTAAMLMAIVADKLQKPLNELRFISIKEVEQ